jgi:UDP-2,3-diacylglucosamine hydrolase
MEEYQCSRLIHGHTHRPAIHNFDIRGIPAQRFVLAEWKKDSAEMLIWTSEIHQIKPL